MKAVQSLALGLAVFTPLASAWPKWLPDVDALVVRQNDESSTGMSYHVSPGASRRHIVFVNLYS